MLEKILITGGAGYIGSHTVLAALDHGWRVAVIDDLSTGVRAAVPESVDFYQEDIANLQKVKEILQSVKPDAVIHFAGSIIVPESVENPVKYYRNNTLGSLALTQACLEVGVKKFIFSSTAAVYGIPESERVTETSCTKPINPYGHSKLMTEQILSDIAASHDFNYSALRYFNVAGADATLRTGQSTENATHLIKVACQTALGLRSGMKVFGTDYETLDGTCVRDFIHVSDLAQAHVDVLCSMSNHTVSRVLNCGNGRGYSVKEILDSVKRVSGVDFPIEFSGRRPGDPPALIADPSKLKSQTKWAPKYTEIDDIVRTAFEWEAGLIDIKKHEYIAKIDKGKYS